MFTYLVYACMQERHKKKKTHLINLYKRIFKNIKTPTQPTSTGNGNIFAICLVRFDYTSGNTEKQRKKKQKRETTH